MLLEDVQPSLHTVQELDGDGVLKELSLVKKINHPGVPRLVESGETEIRGSSVPFGIFEFIPGETLLDMRRRELALEASDVKSWMLQLVKTVAHLHDTPEGICHNQLDLTNVMLDSRNGGKGEAVIIDFGHAHLSAVDPDAVHQLEVMILIFWRLSALTENVRRAQMSSRWEPFITTSFLACPPGIWA